jgi:hypothetical protein
MSNNNMHENKVQICLTLSVKELEKKTKLDPKEKYWKLKWNLNCDRDHGTANFKIFGTTNFKK